MNTNVKIAAIGLAAALVGGSAGATLSSWKSEPVAAQAQQPAPVVVQPAPQVDAAPTTPTDEPLTADASLAPVPRAAATAQPAYVASARRTASAPAPAPVRNTSRARSSSSRQVNYDYSQPRASSAPSAYTYRNERSFWDKHRDKLTVGMGAAGGAILGGLIGGKRGAGIGAIAGAGGSALYTYKVRKRTPNY